ncbi:hypothetical protein POM88_032861 [Heracleum sosnowskyi]|uniref:Bulb-type lectin domain-containing protein n=1 Tax=Heracleum sosnowskyi TaxID=360622 RepID=A0AAD8MLP6_9APIA|nr:hypothetical protein POM88_032861 [Heracleum sosnowskyi]
MMVIVPSFRLVEYLSWDFSALEDPRIGTSASGTRKYQTGQLYGLLIERVQLQVLLVCLGLMGMEVPTGSKIWSSNSSRSLTNPVVGQLLDTGNFAVRYKDDNSDLGNYLWQSFDYPCEVRMGSYKGFR